MDKFREYVSLIFLLLAIFAYITGDTIDAILLMTVAVYAEILNMDK